MPKLPKLKPTTSKSGTAVQMVAASKTGGAMLLGNTEYRAIGTTGDDERKTLYRTLQYNANKRE